MYKHVFFRVDTGYRWGKGLDPKLTSAFFDEIAELFVNAGWELKKHTESYGCPTVSFGKTKLYCHPMELSGPVDIDLIPDIQKILENGKTFYFYATDTYEELLDWDDEKYTAWLDSHKSTIEKEIIAICSLRKNQPLYGFYPVVEPVIEKWHKQRVTEYIGRGSGDLEWMYIENLFNELVASGKIKCKKSIYVVNIIERR